MRPATRLFAILLMAMLQATAVHAEDAAPVLTLKNNAFVPSTLTIPAGQKVKIIIKNTDATPAEFESYALNREKVITANGEISLFIGPLDAGSYEFFDDFHRDTTKGTIIVK